jgi:hypothetical protein
MSGRCELQGAGCSSWCHCLGASAEQEPPGGVPPCQIVLQQPSHRQATGRMGYGSQLPHEGLGLWR